MSGNALNDNRGAHSAESETWGRFQMRQFNSVEMTRPNNSTVLIFSYHGILTLNH